MIAIDFFCGAGGLTRGLLDAGIKVVAGIDADENCRISYERNNSPAKFIHKDIRDVTRKDLLALIGRTSLKDVVFAGCSPCQPFSQQRKGNGRTLDATLLTSFGELVRRVRPGHVLIENVPGIARVRGYSTFRRFLKTLDDMRYRYAYDVIDAKDFGVPQTRRRLVLIAAKGDKTSMPKSRKDKAKFAYKTVREAISHFPPIEAGETHSEVYNHAAASIAEINLNRLRCTPKDGGDRRSWPDHLRLKCHSKDYDGHTDVYGRMQWDAPAPTLTGRCHSISNGRYGHPEEDRAISLREAAAIQTFPDNYIFHGSNKHIALQIGNAVPVNLAQALGRHIRNLDRAKGKVSLTNKNR